MARVRGTLLLLRRLYSADKQIGHVRSRLNDAHVCMPMDGSYLEWENFASILNVKDF